MHKPHTVVTPDVFLNLRSKIFMRKTLPLTLMSYFTIRLERGLIMNVIFGEYAGKAIYEVDYKIYKNRIGSACIV